MMSTLTTLALLATTMQATMSMNPMKTCMMLMTSSLFIFGNMYLKSGTSWFPTVIYMLFTGGILMMFMIVSSMNPNKKMGTMKSKIMVTTIMTSMTLISLTSDESLANQISETKWFFQKEETMTGTIFLIMLYFTSFLVMLSKSSLSLRTSMCQKNKIL